MRYLVEGGDNKKSIYMLSHEDILVDPEIINRFPKQRLGITTYGFAEIGRRRKGQGMKAENAREFNRIVLNSMNGSGLSEGVQLENQAVIQLIRSDRINGSKPELIKGQDYDTIKAAIQLRDKGDMPVIVTGDNHLKLVSRELKLPYQNPPPLDLYSGVLRVDEIARACLLGGNGNPIPVGRRSILPDMGLEDIVYYVGQAVQAYNEHIQNPACKKDPLDISCIEDLVDVLNEPLYANQFIAFQNSPCGIYRYDQKAGTLIPMQYYQGVFKGVKGISPKNIEQVMALELLLNPEIESVSMVGVAGTGKNFLAALAASYLLSKEQVGRYFITKPNEEVGKGHGYLPGDIDEKVRPLLGSFEDNWNEVRKLLSKEQPLGGSYFDDDIGSGVIELVPFAYIQGRTLSDGIQHLDEAQLVGKDMLKMWWSRAGEGSKLILTGDIQMDQIMNDSRAGGVELSSYYNALTITAKTFRDDPTHGHICLYDVVRSRNSQKAQKF